VLLEVYSINLFFLRRLLNSVVLNVYNGRCVALAVCILILLSILSGLPSNALPHWQGTQVDTKFTGSTVGVEETQSISGPTIQDFYVNTTQCSAPVQWNFSLTDSYGLQNATFWWNTGTSDMGNTTYTFFGSPLSGNALFNSTLPSTSQNVTFQFWASNTYNWSTTGVRWMLVYPYSSSEPYFLNLGTAISTIQNANSSTATASDPNMLYAGVVLQQNTTAQLQTMINNFISTQDYLDLLKWSAICNKLNFTQQNDISYALGNYTMLGSLPFTAYDSNSVPEFCTESQWALYGYYYANTTWYKAYSGYNASQWNITAAYQQFNSSVYYSIKYTNGLPLWIYADGTAKTFSNRYYDEDADTIECYILFAELLNVSGAMNQALYWWNYLVGTHWSGSFFEYTPSSALYECEAPFFLEIISMLKYYDSNLANWTDVLTDIGNRFLSSEWTSAQWWDNVVLHASSGPQHPVNSQLRLQNTLGAWQVLLGVYMQLNSAYQNNLKDMLLGNVNTKQAWNLLLQSGLYVSTTYQFCWSSADSSTTSATAWAEILMWMMGIVPGNTTVAFPLEELNYEYIQEIDPALFKMNYNSTLKQVTIPVNSAGTMTFQYGVSPVTCNLNQSGVWQLTFTNSWNMITKVTCLSGLPTNRIYFAQLYPFDVNINAYDGSQGATVNVPISMDGSPTGYVTPYTFGNLTGTHSFTVPDFDEDGSTFEEWSTGETSPTITVVSGGTYTACYETIYTLNITTTGGGTTDPPPGLQYYGRAINVSVTAEPSSGHALDHWELDGQDIVSSNPTVITMNSSHDLHVVFIPIYSIVINAHCITEASDVSLPILLDGSPTNFGTPHTFTGLNDTHTFTVPDADTNGHQFRQWNTGQTWTTISTNSTGTYTAYYGTSPLHDVAVTKIEPSKSVVGQNYSLTVVVTVENLGDYPETFNLTLYAMSTEIGNVTVTDMPNGTSWPIIFLWNTTDWGYGNYTLSAYAWPVPGETDTTSNNFTGGVVTVTIPGDVDGDGYVFLSDLGAMAAAWGSTPTSPNWNPNADIVGEGQVFLLSMAVMAAHWTESWTPP
jgi:hypothetical protein